MQNACCRFGRRHLSDFSNFVQTKLKELRSVELVQLKSRNQLCKIYYLQCQGLSVPPVCYVNFLHFVLSIDEQFNILITLFKPQGLQNLRQVLQGTLGHIADVLQEVENDWQQIRFCDLWPQYGCAFMDGKS